MLLAFVSDIHEDARMLEKALHSALQHGAERIFCLGDITGYTPVNHNFESEKDAAACIALLQEYCELSIAGNHDMYTARRLTAYPAGIEYPDNWYSLSLTEKQQLSKNQIWLYEHELEPTLSTNQMHWLQNLPEFAEIDADGTTIGLSHYIYPDVSGSLQMGHQPNCNAREHRKLFGCNLYFSGHLHPSGFWVQSQEKNSDWKKIGFNEKFTLKKGDYIIVPACLRHHENCGFLLCDTKKHTAVALPCMV